MALEKLVRRADDWFVRGLLVTLCGASVGGISADARASMAYGYTLISAGYVRGCAACHDDEAAQGGLGTANKPFATTMKRLGLTGNGDNDFFRQILNEKLEDYDTDCDGVIDLEELQNNGDVNDPAVVPSGLLPMFVAGCNEGAETGAPLSTATSAPSSVPPVGADTDSHSLAATSSGDDSVAPIDDGVDDDSGSAGCAVARGVQAGRYFGPLAAFVALGFAVARRRRSSL